MTADKRAEVPPTAAAVSAKDRLRAVQ